jgi:hypothetical protein
MNSFFTWYIFLEVGKTQDLPSKIWQTLRDAHRPAHIHVLAFWPVRKIKSKNSSFILHREKI